MNTPPSNARRICLTHMPQAMQPAYARTDGRTNEEPTHLCKNLTFRNARRGGTQKPPKKVTHQTAAATRQAANHA